MKVIDGMWDLVVKIIFRVVCRPTRRLDLERIGSRYGGWIVPTDFLHPKGICYSAGSGEDITFDLELARRFGCEVYAIDPTPRSQRYVGDVAAGVPGFHSVPMGLWSSTRRMRFYAPRDRHEVSHSIANLQRTMDFFEADCVTVADLMARNGHRELDLLKMDIEGAEYDVLRNIIATEVRVRILCVEFHRPGALQRTIRMARQLKQAGFELVSVDGFNFTFLY